MINKIKFIVFLFCMYISRAAWAVPVNDVMEIHVIPNVGGIPVTINLDNVYTDAIPVCSYNLPSNNALPAVVRINSVGSTTLTLHLGLLEDAPGTSVTPGNVHCVIVEEGAHDVNGTPIEARKVLSDGTVGRNTSPNWTTGANNGWNNNLENITSLITTPFTNPVVLGQVMSSNDPLPSIYYANDCTLDRRVIPFNNGNGICVGKHISREVGTRVSETIGVIIAGTTNTTGASGSTGGFRAGTTPRFVAGTTNNPPYSQNTVETYSVGIVSQLGERGGDGAWAVLYGPDPLANNQINLAIEESLINNTNRNHTTEVVNYLVVTVPTITLEKVVVGGGPRTADDFTLSFSGITNNSGTSGSTNVTSFPVQPGTYILSESSLAQYTQTDLSCNGGSLTGNELQLTAFDFATCTFTNTFEPASAAGVDISGNIFEDLDSNGVLNGTEDWSRAVSVFINIVDTQNPTEVVQSVQVNPGTGDYTFTSVPPGDYELVLTDSQINVQPVAPEEWIFIDPSAGTQTLTVAGGNITGENFALFHAPILSLTKTTTTSTVVNTSAGTTADYQIRLTNEASLGGDAQVVKITDVLPTGFTYDLGSTVFTVPATGNCLAGASRISAVNPADGASGTITWGDWTVPAGCEVIIDFSVNIPNTVADATYDNSASVTTVTSPATISNFDGTLSNDENVTVTSAVLSVTKESLIKTIAPGALSSYRIVVSNNGTATAEGVVITDVLATDFSYNSTTSITGTNTRTAVNNPAAGATSPVWGTFDIPAAGSVILEFTADIDAAIADAFYQNSASATSSNAAVITNYDGNVPANNTDDIEVVTTSPVTDLSITKTDGINSAVPGNGVVYSIVVTNTGTDVSGAGVTDIFDPNIFDVANITWSCAITSGSGVCTNPGPATGNINTTVDLTAGSVATFTATAPILSNATGVIDNTAAVAPPAGTVDSNVSNNTALDNNTVLAPGGDIVITKDDGISSVVAGTTTTYTITVQNNGPSDMVGATVTDTFDPNDVNVPNVDWTCAIDSGSTGACGAVSGSGNISTSLSLTAGSSATFTAIVPVRETAVTPLINNAVLTTPAAFNNTNAANSTATDNNTISSAQADLEITKITSNGAPSSGENFTYTVTLFNNGASGATNVVVTDTFPGNNFNFVSAVVQQGAGADRTFNNNGASLTWNIPFLPSGNSATIEITANITAAGIQTNSAEVTSTDQDDPDSTPANGVLTEDDMDSVDVNVGGAVVIADLQITKTDTSTTAVPGTPITYSIVVSNDAGSPSNVAGAIVEDLFDPTYFDVPNVSWTCTITSGSGVCGSTGPVLGDINTTVDLNVGSAATFTVTAPVLANASGTVSNTATVTAPTGVTETNPGNNSAVDNNTVLGPVADLSITNVVDNPTPNIGDLVTFNIEVTNNGPSDATNVTVRDILPSGYAFDLAGTSATQGSYDNASGDWTVGTLSTSAPTQTLSLAATVMGTGDYVTVAQVWTSDAPDPDSTPANDLATEDDYQEASITTILESDLSIISVVDNLTPIPGQNVTFTLTVNNAGPSVATSVIVEDRLPTGFTYVSSSISSSNGDETASSCVHVNGVVTCELNSVDIGVDDVIELVAFSNPTTEGTTQTNVAEIVSATELDSDSVHGNNILSEDDQQSIDISVSTADQANLTLTKTVDDPEPLPFQNIEYTVVISNAGPADATNVEIVDTLPAGLDFVSAVVSGGDATEFCALAGQALTCDMGTVTVASPETVTITAAAQSGQEGNTLTNSVEVTEVDNSDPNSVKNNGVTTEDDYAEVDITVTAPVPVVDGIIEGYVFEDNGASAIPHDGQIEGSEAPFAGSEVQVYATTGALVASAVTDATGRYSLTLPLPPPPDPDCDYSAAALSDGFGFNHTTGQSCPPIDRAEYRILVEAPNNTIGISEFFSVSPADTGTIVPGTPANALIDFVHRATETNSYEINFGFIRPPTWQSDGTAEGSAGDKIYHAHQFTAQSDGDIAFTYTNVTANPASTAFSSTLFEDVNCNGALDAGDNPITGTVIDADVNPTVCVLDEVTIPANASGGDTYTATIQASIFYTDTIGSNHAVSHTEEVTNVTDVVVAHEVFGFVFEDNGNSATAHDGSFDGLEPPTGGVTVQLFNSSAGTLIDSTITNADGSYSILVPDGVESELRVVAVSKEGYQWISEAFSNTEGVVGLATPGIPIDGEVSFTHNAGFANQYQVNFGQIKNAEWTGDRLTENRPGTSVLHAHKLRAHSAAVLIFEYSEQTANPPNTGFTAGLFEDINCNGVLDPEDSTIDPSIVGDIEVEASNGNSEICVINRVFIPTNASNDQTHTSIVAATLIYSDEGSTGHGFRETLLVTDVTRVLAPGNGVLQLSKTVQNVTESGAESTRNEASPDDILRYTIDFENSGTGPVTEVLIVDTTPAFTQLEQAVECPASLPAGVISCDVIEPSVVDNVSGYEGTVQWQFNGSLPSGAGGSVQYDIRIQ